MMPISNNLLYCLKVFHQCSSSFPLLCRIQHCPLICTKIFYLCLDFFLLLLLFVLNSIYDFSHWDSLNSNTRCIFLVLALVLNKIAIFSNEAHTFLDQKS